MALQNQNNLPTAGEMNSLLIACDRPLLLRGFLDNWPLLEYKARDWEELFGKPPLTCRLGRQRHRWDGDTPQFEGKCRSAQCTFEEFRQWQESRSEHPVLKEHSPADWFIYFDYKYMTELFDEGILDAVDWSGLGFPGRSGRESTLWMGTRGANTPCHYDTYGCNLVAQLSGRKRWILFPPADAEFLRPTRIPYEESSVYSKIDFQRFDTAESPSLLGHATPHIVTLQPGDVLYLPRHWWHYVENLETSVSINTWIELEQDSEVRVQEALVKVLMACASKSVPDGKAGLLLNPNENSTRSSSLDETLQYVTASLDTLDMQLPTASSSDEELVREMTKKYPDRIQLVTPTDVPQQHKKPKMTRNAEEEPILHRVLNAFSRPEVLRAVADILRAEPSTKKDVDVDPQGRHS